MKTELCHRPTRPASARARELLRQGEIIALPTETVYGIAADAYQQRGGGQDLQGQGPPPGQPPHRAHRRHGDAGGAGEPGAAPGA